MPEILSSIQQDGTPTLTNPITVTAATVLRPEVSGLLTQPGNAVGDALAGKAGAGDNADIAALDALERVQQDATGISSYDSRAWVNPPDNWTGPYTDFNCRANSVYRYTNTEVITKSGNGGMRDYKLVHLRDRDSTNYEASGYRVISNAMRVVNSGNFDGGGYVTQWKDLHGGWFTAVGSIGGIDRGVSGVLAEALQFGTGVATNEFSAMSVQGSPNKPQLLAPVISIVYNYQGDGDGEHRRYGFAASMCGYLSTAAFRAASVPAVGQQGAARFGVQLDELIVTEAGITMPQSPGNEGTIIRYTPAVYSYVDRETGKFYLVSSNSNALSAGGPSDGVDFTAAESLIPSAATVNIGAEARLKIAIAGQTAVTSFGTVPNKIKFVRLVDSVLIVNNPTSLRLPGNANINGVYGDTFIAVSDAGGNWQVYNYQRTNGKPIVGPSSGDISDASSSGVSVLTGTPAQGATALGLGVGNTPTHAGINLSAAAGSFRTLAYQTSGLQRFTANISAEPETGSNTGSNFAISRHSDAGAFLDNPLTINRATGQTSLQSLAVAATATFGSLTVGTGAIADASLKAQINAAGGTAYFAANRSSGIYGGLFGWDVAFGGVVVRSVNAADNLSFVVGGSTTAMSFAPSGAATMYNNLSVGDVVAQYPNSLTLRASAHSSGSKRAALLFGAGSDVGWSIFQDSAATGVKDLGFYCYGVGRSVLTLGANGSATFTDGVSVTGGQLGLPKYTVATLPAGNTGSLAYVSNGRKVGEGSGAGTGVIAYFSGLWRRPSDDTQVAA